MHVDNQVEVLPLSPFDDRLRVAVARAVYGQPALNGYADVTLEGVVSDDGARHITNIHVSDNQTAKSPYWKR